MRARMAILVAALSLSGAAVGASTSCSPPCPRTMLAAAHCPGNVHQLPNSPGRGYGEQPGDGTVGPI